MAIKMHYTQMFNLLCNKIYGHFAETNQSTCNEKVAK